MIDEKIIFACNSPSQYFSNFGWWSIGIYYSSAYPGDLDKCQTDGTVGPVLHNPVALAERHVVLQHPQGRGRVDHHCGGPVHRNVVANLSTQTALIIIGLNVHGFLFF